jgi:uncharacterized protein (DUF2147 family)
MATQENLTMLRRITPFIGALALVAALGCDTLTPTPPPNTDIVGNWTQPNGSLQIFESGQVQYEENSKGNKSIQAPAQSWTDDSFVVGAMGVNTTFKIDAAPHQDPDGVWKMTVDGVEYTKQ